MDNSITTGEIVRQVAVRWDMANGDPEGDPIQTEVRRLKDLAGVFSDENAYAMMNPEKEIYRVSFWSPVAPGTTGGLFIGSSRIMPGRVGAEYFMTKGHFHDRQESAEFYWGVKGEGLLLLMDADRKCRAEKVAAGSVHYIPAFTAHRLVNVGTIPLICGACWPSDAGHDYARIAKTGFSVRVFMKDALPFIQHIH